MTDGWYLYLKIVLPYRCKILRLTDKTTSQPTISTSLINLQTLWVECRTFDSHSSTLTIGISQLLQLTCKSELIICWTGNIIFCQKETISMKSFIILKHLLQTYFCCWYCSTNSILKTFLSDCLKSMKHTGHGETCFLGDNFPDESFSYPVRSSSIRKCFP